MGVPSEVQPVKIVMGVLAASSELLDEARAALAEAVAAVELSSAARRWSESRYYCAEMGDEIWRQFVALHGLAPPHALAALKRRTNALEQRWTDARGRRVNLDPGYVDLDKLVLASTKNAAHRVYLGRGIFAEATLHFTASGFAGWPYTYADYAAPDALTFFNAVRARYRAERPRPESRPDRRGRRGASRPLRSPA